MAKAAPNSRCKLVRPSLALLLLPLLFLCSCIEGEEEIWINPDASGRIRAEYSFPKIALSKIGDPQAQIALLKSFDAQEDLISFQTIDLSTKGSRAIFLLDGTFTDARDLVEVGKRAQEFFPKDSYVDPNQLDGALGKVTFKLEKLHPHFRRTIPIGNVFPNVIRNFPGMLGESKFRYIMNLPAPALENNADHISEDRLSLTWDFLLKDHLQDPMLIEFRSRPPIPWWAWLSAGAFLLAVLFLIWRRIKRGRRV